MNSLASISFKSAIRASKPAFSRRCFTSRDPKTAENENGRDPRKFTDAEKAKNLNGKVISTVPEFPRWNEDLASESEIVVKADRSKDKPISQLQEESLNILQKKDKQDGNMKAQ
eukprot:TRINITY_DN1459_c0_g1_i1.p2 TRINITY_DN1459_c0_g1~~TRINITY_DN1459_c0_g1_i1.p2  ORF type:complete len:114 (+),score=17.67 TRINITY_DN1459_c0_g1_i1:43-384(+)